jgi:hypothetical protein
MKSPVFIVLLAVLATTGVTAIVFELLPSIGTGVVNQLLKPWFKSSPAAKQAQTTLMIRDVLAGLPGLTVGFIAVMRIRKGSNQHKVAN